MSRASFTYFGFIIALAAIASIGSANQRHATGGDINDLFTDEETMFYSDEYAALKDSLGLDAAAVEKAYRKVERRLERQAEMLREAAARQGADLIPSTSFRRIAQNGGRLPDGIADKVRKRGVLIVRGVIPAKEIEEMMSELVKYMYENKAFPKGGINGTQVRKLFIGITGKKTQSLVVQSVYEVYWSKSQMRARQHPNLHAVMLAMLDLWHVSGDKESVDVDLKKPAMYVDRLRIRPPGDSKVFI